MTDRRSQICKRGGHEQASSAVQGNRIVRYDWPFETSRDAASASTAGPEQQRALHPTWYDTSSPTPAPEARKPLTDDQIYEAFREHDKTHPLVASAWSFEAGFRFAERHYGIQHPADGAEGGKA